MLDPAAVASFNAVVVAARAASAASRFCCTPSAVSPDRVPETVVSVSPDPEVTVTSSDTVIVPSTLVMVTVMVCRSKPPLSFSMATLKLSVVLSPVFRAAMAALPVSTA